MSFVSAAPAQQTVLSYSPPPRETVSAVGGYRTVHVTRLSDRVQKFVAKTSPDRVGARYGSVKTVSLKRFVEGAGIITAVRIRIRDILEREGVPAAQQAPYYAFAFKLASKAMSHSSEELKSIAEGLKEWFAAKGCDPRILDLIESVLIG